MKVPEVVPMHKAKSKLSQLVKRAAAGETVLIGPNGHAVAKLTSLDSSVPPTRRLGLLKGKLGVHLGSVCSSSKCRGAAVPAVRPTGWVDSRFSTLRR